ncbi:MAG: sulfotransferase family 2 domain-containing protein [Longimicrobiales bacterium]
MFLSVRHRILFVHIAKTGGTSIRAALARLRWTDPYSIPIYIGNHLARATKYRTGCKLHRHAKAITAQDMLGHDNFAQLFKFSFVRNPWDLHVSSWLHVKQRRHEGWDMEFPDFLKARFDPGRAPSYGMDTLREPQVRYLSDFDGQPLVDFVGRFENLNADFKVVCRKAKLPELPLPHKRRAVSRRDYREYYTDELAEFVGKIHHLDLVRFGYTFDPVGVTA